MYFPADYLEYDWYSGLWECTPEATLQFGVGVFGGWMAAFLVPAF
jgi:hypothetical protein